MGVVERPWVTRDVSCPRTRVACGNRGRPTMERRKFLVGMGSLAAGGAAATGTGAVTSMSADRSVTAKIDADPDSQIAFKTGNDPDIGLTDGEITLDLTGSGNEGVNINSRYTWGDPDNPSSNYAFKIVNQDNTGEDYYMNMEYRFDDTSWIDERQGQSFIEFTVYHPYGPGSKNYPDQRGNYNQDFSINTSGQYQHLTPGDEWPVVVTIDTTGEHASTSDKLSGSANFEFTKSIPSQTSWIPGN